MGPFGAEGGPEEEVETAMSVTTEAFDPAVTSSTGDLWLAASDPELARKHRTGGRQPGRNGDDPRHDHTRRPHRQHRPAELCTSMMPTSSSTRPTASCKVTRWRRFPTATRSAEPARSSLRLGSVSPVVLVPETSEDRRPLAFGHVETAAANPAVDSGGVVPHAAADHGAWRGGCCAFKRARFVFFTTGYRSAGSTARLSRPPLTALRPPTAKSWPRP